MPQTARASDPAYLKAAFSKLGLSEIEGARHEKQILAMYAASGHPEIHDDETPWCAAFVGWCLEQGGLKGTHSLMAKSYATYGQQVPRTGDHYLVPRGAIAVWTRHGGGHVNFVLSDDGTYVTCIGGNQENGKGGGVTISQRRKADAVAFRLPRELKEAHEPPKKRPQESEIKQPAPPAAPSEVPATPMARPSPNSTSEAPAETNPAEPDDTQPHAAPKGAPKTGVTEGAQAAGGLGVLGFLYSIWEQITQAPDAIVQAVVAAAQRPQFWLFACVVGAGAYIWWRRSRMKKAS